MKKEPPGGLRYMACFLKKMLGFPNKPMGLFPTKNDQHLGCEMGVPPFKETSIYIGDEIWIPSYVWMIS